MPKITVLLQEGHVAPREPGFEPQTGGAGEIEFNRMIVNKISWFLTKDGHYRVVRMPGRIRPWGVTAGLAIFCHADSSDNPQSRGWSLGYPTHADGSVPWSSHRFAEAVALYFNRIPHPGPRRPDNYTPNMAGYYGYSRVNTNGGPELLIEFGTLSNDRERAWMTSTDGSTELARAVYHAIASWCGIKPTH